MGNYVNYWVSASGSGELDIGDDKFLLLAPNEGSWMIPLWSVFEEECE